ncbi:MAG: right-handed parallel beta-helix repeat-containing protein [Planctomycetota bacterium]
MFSRARRPGYVLAISLAFLGASAGALVADTLSVPDEYPTIQLAIDAAVDGDTVAIAPGTYDENISTLGKEITVLGTGGAEVTTIDGSLPLTTVGSTVLLSSGSTEATIIDGLTIRGGIGTPSFYGQTGGGVFISGAGTIRNCIVEDNTAFVGAGIAALNSTGTVTVDNCIVRSNVAADPGGGLIAGGIGNLVVTHCEFRNNVSDGGGAIACSTLTCLIENCSFIENSVVLPTGVFGGALSIGPVHAETSTACTDAQVIDCEFIDNTSGFAGGAAIVYQCPTEFVRCTFVGNEGSAVGAIACDSTQLTLSYCLFHGNVASEDGELFSSGVNGSDVTVDHCTFADNNCGGGVYHAGFAPFGFDPVLTVTNSIAWGNSNSTWDTHPNVDATYAYSNLEGGQPGVGMLDVDPLFVAPSLGLYRLAEGSPCIDAGDPGFPFDSDGTVTDLGAIPYDPSAVGYIRGDANQDARVDLADGIFVLSVSFAGEGAFLCEAAADSNGDETTDVADALFIFNYQLLGGPAPSAPFPDCGTSDASDTSCDAPIGCESS